MVNLWSVGEVWCGRTGCPTQVGDTEWGLAWSCVDDKYLYEELREGFSSACHGRSLLRRYGVHWAALR